MNAVKFSELFAGVGLFRLGLEHVGWHCVFANDIDADKAEIYTRNFGAEEFVLGDIARVTADVIPSTDVVTASFPCQDISLAGKRAGLAGSRSNTFFEFVRIVRGLIEHGRKPKAVVIENVTGLLTSNQGKDISVVLSELNSMDYRCDLLVLDAASFLPQSRPRVFVLGTDSSLDLEVSTVPHPARNQSVQKVIANNPHVRWGFLPLDTLPMLTGELKDVIEASADNWFDSPTLEREISYVRGLSRSRLDRAHAKALLLQTPSYLTGYRRMRDGMICLELRDDGIAGCLRTPGGGSSRQILVEVSTEGVRMRFLTSREYARLQGVDDTYWIPKNQTKGLHAFGDAVAVPVIEWLGRQLSRALMGKSTQSGLGEDIVKRPGISPSNLPITYSQDTLPF